MNQVNYKQKFCTDFVFPKSYIVNNQRVEFIFL